MDAVDSSGLVMPVSVWIKKLDVESADRCLVVIEPVERSTATVTFDSTVSRYLGRPISMFVKVMHRGPSVERYSDQTTNSSWF